jgi:hypothetical protein
MEKIVKKETKTKVVIKYLNGKQPGLGWCYRAISQELITKVLKFLLEIRLGMGG